MQSHISGKVSVLHFPALAAEDKEPLLKQMCSFVVESKRRVKHCFTLITFAAETQIHFYSLC